MKIDVKINGLDALKAKLRGLSDGKIKVAAVAALNDAAYAGAQAVKVEINRVFDRPTPFIQKSAVYFKAGLAGKRVRVPGAFDIRGVGLSNPLKADRLEAVIDLSGEGNKQGVTPSMVLAAQISGGLRKHKRHEIALQRAGILPPGMAIVPGPGAAKDQYGNISAGQIVQIMSWFKSFGEQGYKANSTAKTRARLAKDKRNGTKGFEYFALQKKQGKLSPGIYQRFTFASGSAIKPIMYFVRMPAYKRRLDFYGIANKVAVDTFNKAYPMYLDKLLRERGL